MDKTKPFGLILPKKSSQLFDKNKSVFGDSDDNEDVDKSSNKKSKLTFASKSKSFKEIVDDPSIFEYDSIYDDMKAKQIEEIAPKIKKNSRYIQSLIKASDKRKKEYEKRIEKKIQIEREKEGDEFKDKEAFVTAAYKKKMQEAEEEEERERRENELNDLMDVTKQNDLSGFYRHFLKQTVGEEKIPKFGEEKIIKKEKVDENVESIEKTKENNSEIILASNDSKNSNKVDKISKTNNVSLAKNKRKHTDEKSHFIKSSYSPKNKESNNIDENLPKNKRYENNLDVESGSIRSDAINGSNISHNANEIDDETEKYPQNHSIRDVSSSESGEDSHNRNVKKLSAKVQLTKRDDSSSESDEDSHNGNVKKLAAKVQLTKRDDSFSESDEDSHIGNVKKLSAKVQLTKRHDSSSDEDSVNVENNDQKHEEAREKIDIFAKRTIGIKFDEAQARYFERLALRKAKHL